MDGWFVEEACVFIAKVLTPVAFTDGNWERVFFMVSAGVPE